MYKTAWYVSTHKWKTNIKCSEEVWVVIEWNVKINEAILNLENKLISSVTSQNEGNNLIL